MAEWFKAHAWKACKEVTLSWVRIPFSPPEVIKLILIKIDIEIIRSCIVFVKYFIA